MICVKDPRVDEWVSGGILASGVWEKEIVVEVMRTMDQYPDAVFMDIGSNIGQYIVISKINMIDISVASSARDSMSKLSRILIFVFLSSLVQGCTR